MRRSQYEKVHVNIGTIGLVMVTVLVGGADPMLATQPENTV